MKAHKYIFVTGGVMSGLGKGVITASISKLLQLCDLKVSSMKIDPYINFDAGTMNPLMHGEVFVTDDGGECDMDIGNYERFLDIDLTKEHNITTGQIYHTVIERERKGEYLGECVQIIPHITNEIKNRIKKVAEDEDLDILVVECGGTVGDIESLPFLEAMRQMKLEGNDILFVHVTLAPTINTEEIKTKPTQHSVQELRKIGIQPDIIAVRSKVALDNSTKRKIGLFANVNLDSVISSHDVSSIYKVPEILEEQGIVDIILKRLNYNKKFSWMNWRDLTKLYDNLNGEVSIAMVGKYVKLSDSYVSVNHALEHSALSAGYKIKIDMLDSEIFENDRSKLEILNNYNGILVPGGFGKRGSEGIIRTADYARIKNIPYLGICFGFQLAIVAFARSVCNIESANSTELDPDTKDPVVDLLPEQKEVDKLGGTMRLGSHEIDIITDTIASKLYNREKIVKRHRHRYEFNQVYKNIFEKLGMRFSAFSDNNKRAEILELNDHKFYIGVQYHAEFSSRFGKPEEVFLAFVKASADNKIKR